MLLVLKLFFGLQQRRQKASKMWIGNFLVHQSKQGLSKQRMHLIVFGIVLFYEFWFSQYFQILIGKRSANNKTAKRFFA